MKKNWRDSKAMWSGGLLFIAGVLTLVATYMQTGEIELTSLIALLNGSGIIGIRDAIPS